MNAKPLGYNPMRWNCDKSGCYNIKHRPKIEIFADVWPGRISIGDVDGIVEIQGKGLLLEWKSHNGQIPTGQRIMYQRLTTGMLLTVFCVYGDAETMDVFANKVFFNGLEEPKNKWEPSDLSALKKRLKAWCEWAQRSSFEPR